MQLPQAPGRPRPVWCAALRRTRLQPPTEAVGTVVRALREYHAGTDLEDDAVIVCLDWFREELTEGMDSVAAG